MATTLLQLRTRVRQRADVENSTFISDIELNQLINTSYSKLYGLLIRHSLQRAESVFTLTATGAASYALPSDFFSCIGVYYLRSTEPAVPLERLPDKFRPGTRTESTATHYRLTGATLTLYPRTSGSYEMVYIPIPGTLVLDADVLDGVLGWEEFVVVDAAIAVLHKEESDAKHLLFERQELMNRVIDEANAVEFTTTIKIQNVYDDWRENSDPADGGW